MSARNRMLFLLSGLCLLCLAGGFQSAEAVRLWQEGGVAPPSTWKIWSETLKASAMVFLAFAVFLNLATTILRGSGAEGPPPPSPKRNARMRATADAARDYDGLR